MRKVSAKTVEKAVRVTRSAAGRVCSQRKAASSRENGKLGGRPALGIGDARQIYRDWVKELFGDLRKLPKEQREAAREECRRCAEAEVQNRIMMHNATNQTC